MLNLVFGGTALSHVFKRCARSVREADNSLPFSRCVNRYDARCRINLFVGPETPAYLILLKQRPERCDPFVGVLARLSHPNGYIVFVTKVNVILNGVFVYVHPVFVK